VSVRRAAGSRAKRARIARAASFDALELTGRTHTHVVELDDPRCVLHRQVVAPFRRMRAAAAKAGIDLVPASSFRDFDRQLAIWNAKWRGERPVLDAHGRALDPARLRPARRVDAILVWSAAPGCSRHHWGTDFDVYDRAAVPGDYRLQLVPEEYAPDGPFARLTAWLDAHMHRWGFYRPYATDRGGVRPEPWHLSHAPTAREASRRLRVAALRDALAGADVEGRDALLARLPDVYARYVRNVDRPPRR
jgi:LAS superfamily LD-carboxypeptidase LdcB